MASKRSYWHPVGYLIEKFMAPFLDTCADIHLESIDYLEKAYKYYNNFFKIAKYKYENIPNLKENEKCYVELLNLIENNKNILKYINIFDQCNIYYDDISVLSLLKDAEEHIHNFPRNIIILDDKENNIFSNSLKEIQKIKDEFNKKIPAYINDIIESLSPINLWYLNYTELVSFSKEKLQDIKNLLDKENINTKEAKALADELNINNFETSLSDYIQTAYYLRMMIAIASESLRFKNKPGEEPVFVEDFNGLVDWINKNIAQSVLKISKWETYKGDDKRIIVDTGGKERFKNIDYLNKIKRFSHIKGTFIRWLVIFYDYRCYEGSNFLNEAKGKKYKNLTLARVCPHCRHLIINYDEKKFYCHRNVIPKN